MEDLSKQENYINLIKQFLELPTEVINSLTEDEKQKLREKFKLHKKGNDELFKIGSFIELTVDGIKEIKNIQIKKNCTLEDAMSIFIDTYDVPKKMVNIHGEGEIIEIRKSFSRVLRTAEKKNKSEDINNQSVQIRNLSTYELTSLIGVPIYAIRNGRQSNDIRRNFYISSLTIKNIIIAQDGIWIDTGIEIFNESELGSRFSFNKEEAKKILDIVKSQPLNNISQIFDMNIIKDREQMLYRQF